MLKERKTQNSDPGHVSAGFAKRLSLRDPAGSLIELEGRLYRIITEVAWPEFERISASFIVKKLIQERKLVDFRVLSDEEANTVMRKLKSAYPAQTFSHGKILEHKKIEFVIYPNEWCSEMLRQAGLLTLEIAERLLDYGLGLKDATPFNILFEYNHPIFVDILSIEEREPTSGTWMAYGQFCKTFVNTLLLTKHFKVSFEKSLANNRDGLPVETVFSLLSLRQKLSPSFFSRVTLPILLSKLHNPAHTSIYQKKTLSKERAAFTLRYFFSGLRKALARLKPAPSSAANMYMEQQLPYSQEEFEEKVKLVGALFSNLKPKRVLDLGSNTGHFSVLAARAGAKVISVDTDSAAIEALYLQAKDSSLSILPMQMDITSPTPSTGWENEERASFMSRASGQSDTVLMLALIHHLQTTHSIPLEAIASLASKLTSNWLIIEHISPTDPIFSGLARGRDYSYATDVYFEKVFGNLFTVEQKTVQKNSTRTLYLMKKNPDA